MGEETGWWKVVIPRERSRQVIIGIFLLLCVWALIHQKLEHNNFDLGLFIRNEGLISACVLLLFGAFAAIFAKTWTKAIVVLAFVLMIGGASWYVSRHRAPVPRPSGPESFVEAKLAGFAPQPNSGKECALYLYFDVTNHSQAGVHLGSDIVAVRTDGTYRYAPDALTVDLSWIPPGVTRTARVTLNGYDDVCDDLLANSKPTPDVFTNEFPKLAGFALIRDWSTVSAWLPLGSKKRPPNAVFEARTR